MPSCFPIILCLSILPIAIATTWRHVGVGRVVHAYPYDSRLLVVTDLGILARLSIENGSVIWRSIPPPGGAELFSVALVPDSAKGAVVVTQGSGEKVIAFVADDGEMLWHRSGCGVRNRGGGGVLLDACDGTQEDVDAATGEAITDVEQDPSLSDPLPNTWTAVSSELPAQELTWTSPACELRSFVDGHLSLSRGDREVWSREEGLAHVSHAALYTTRNAQNVLITLSKLGKIYGLDTRNEGNVMWKAYVDVGCVLVTGHSEVAVVVCTGKSVTNVIALKVESGESIMKKTIDGFVAKQAVVEGGCCPSAGQVCVRLLSASGQEKTIASSPECAVLNAVPSRGWLLFEKGGTALHGLSDGKKTWYVDMPSNSVIVAVEAGKRLHPSSSRIRPPAVRVTGDRRVMFKHIDQNMVLVLSENEKESLVHAMLMDAKTGSLYDVVTHPEATGPVSAVRGESWFVYSFWSTLMLEQEIHIIDTYEPETEVTRVHQALHGAAHSALGSQLMNAFNLSQRVGVDQCLALTADDCRNTQCDSEAFQVQNDAAKTPVIIRSSMLTTKRIRGLDVTETTLGLTEPSIAITLESGQIALVSKILLDARRPKDRNGFSPTEYLIPYRALLNLQSTSPESQYVSFGEDVVGARLLAVAPVHKRESMCQIVVVGIDVLYALVRPVGSFDALPDDFSYVSVVAMILALGSGFFYTQRMKKKASLSRSW